MVGRRSREQFREIYDVYKCVVIESPDPGRDEGQDNVKKTGNWYHGQAMSVETPQSMKSVASLENHTVVRQGYHDVDVDMWCTAATAASYRNRNRVAATMCRTAHNDRRHRGDAAFEGAGST